MHPVSLFTIGHSTHGIDEFVALLEMNSVESLVDIRTVPKSLHNPQFHTDNLASSLPASGIGYQHLASLGGWRKADPNSVNTGWRNKSFRGYADYSVSAEFATGINELQKIAAEKTTVIMCSEALWWRCHRRLVADRLITQGDVVLHIGSNGSTSEHELTSFAIVGANGQITYPPEKPNQENALDGAGPIARR